MTTYDPTRMDETGSHDIINLLRDEEAAEAEEEEEGREAEEPVEGWVVFDLAWDYYCTECQRQIQTQSHGRYNVLLANVLPATFLPAIRIARGIGRWVDVEREMGPKKIDKGEV